MSWELLEEVNNNPYEGIPNLQIGRAGEYITAADLILKGFDCFHSAQGMPYDLVADINGELLKVQVKTTATTRPVPQRSSHIPAYLFWINRCGRGGTSGYAKEEVDLFALVSLKEMLVGYWSASSLPNTIVLRSPELRGQYSDERVAHRNALALARLGCGASLMEVCEEFGINKSYAYKIKQRKTTNGVGTYLSDLTLEKALGEFYANR